MKISLFVSLEVPVRLRNPKLVDVTLLPQQRELSSLVKRPRPLSDLRELNVKKQKLEPPVMNPKQPMIFTSSKENYVAKTPSFDQVRFRSFTTSDQIKDINGPDHPAPTKEECYNDDVVLPPIRGLSPILPRRAT